MAQHIVRVDAGDRSLVAVPVFPLRNFTARDLYTRKGSTLMLAQLSGKRIGIYSWAASGAVWYRHLVRHLGNDYKSIHWIVGGADTAAVPAQVVPLPAGVTVAPSGKSLSDLLLAGDIDAFFAPLPPKLYSPADGSIAAARCRTSKLSNSRYFAKTRCYPPQHAIVIRRARVGARSLGRREARGDLQHVRARVPCRAATLSVQLALADGGRRSGRSS